MADADGQIVAALPQVKGICSLFKWDNVSALLRVTATGTSDEYYVDDDGYEEVLVALTRAKVSTGKWYWEVTRLSTHTWAGEAAMAIVGFTDADTEPEFRTCWAIDLDSGDIYKRDFSGVTYSADSATIEHSDVIQIAVDLDAEKIWFGVNNTWVGGGDPEEGTGANLTGITGDVGPFVGYQDTESSVLTRIDYADWAYASPVGFLGLNGGGTEAEIEPDPPVVPEPGEIFRWDVLATDLSVNADETVLSNSLTGSRLGMSSQTASEGKLYWEYEIGGSTVLSSVGISISNAITLLGFTADSWCYDLKSGRGRHNNTNGFTGDACSTGDIIGVAVNMTTGELWFSRNNTWQGAGSPNPATGLSPNYNNVAGDIRIGAQLYQTTEEVTFLGTPSKMNYDPPVGFVALMGDYNFGRFAPALAEVSGYADSGVQITLASGVYDSPTVLVSGVADNPIITVGGIDALAPSVNGSGYVRPIGFGRVISRPPLLESTAVTMQFGYGSIKASGRLWGKVGETGKFIAKAPTLSGWMENPLLGIGTMVSPRPILQSFARSTLLGVATLHIPMARISGETDSDQQQAVVSGAIAIRVPSMSGGATQLLMAAGDVSPVRPRLYGKSSMVAGDLQVLRYNRNWRCSL